MLPIAPTFGQDPGPPGLPPPGLTVPAPPTPAAQGEKIDAQITHVDGRVQVRLNPNAPWQIAQVGMNLDEGSGFRTGLRGRVKFVIQPGQEVTLDRLTRVTIAQAKRNRGKSKTEMVMPYGRTRFVVEKAGGVEHDTKIATPSTTLAVRGTDVMVFDQPPFIPKAVSFEGQARFRDLRRQVIAFGGRGTVTVQADKDDPASTAAADTRNGRSIGAARTAIEEELVELLPALEGLEFLPRPHLVFDFEPQIIQGSLSFDLTWSGMADVDLFVFSPAGEAVSLAPSPFKIVLPNGAEQVASGGVFLGDDNAVGGSGTERITWDTSYLSGSYRYGLQYASGNGPAQFGVEVRINANLVKNFGLNGTVSPEVPIVEKTIHMGDR